ncbi:MAG: thioredoxin family protein [Candidatus Dormibacteraeota bacterium]|nr:thioredoxin family protein [Candidatus Dormibacteraeota bacterium]
MNPLLLAPIIAIAVLGAAALVLVVQRSGQRRLIGHVVLHGDAIVPAEGPSILYFTGVNCTICHTAQRPALRRLEELLDGLVPIHEVDVADEPELARRYRVLSLPTTIVLRDDQSVAAINVGFATAETLQSQLDAAGLRTRELATA